MEIEIQPAVPDRVIGILGGMGPEATLDLYRDIIRLTPAKRDQDHIRVLIYSNPKIPDRTMGIEQTGESPVPSLIESARILEKGGAGIIAMPCNAAHHFLPEIQRQITIPVLDMIEEACRRLCERFPGLESRRAHCLERNRAQRCVCKIIGEERDFRSATGRRGPAENPDSRSIRLNSESTTGQPGRRFNPSACAWWRPVPSRLYWVARRFPWRSIPLR